MENENWLPRMIVTVEKIAEWKKQDKPRAKRQTFGGGTDADDPKKRTAWNPHEIFAEEIMVI